MAQRQPGPAPDATPRLVWAGRDDARVVLADDNGTPRRVDARHLPRPRLQPLETVGDADNRVLWGDNWLAHRALLADGWAGRFKLAYLDPPFGTGRRFEHYDDAQAIGDWLSMMRDRLVQIHALLADDGSLILHLDDHRIHHARLLLDEIFGPTNFRNSLVIKRVYKNVGRQFERVQALPLAHDIALLYSKDPATRYRLPELPKPHGPRQPGGYWKDFSSTADRPTMRYELLGRTLEAGQWKWCRARAERAVANYQAYVAGAGDEPLVDYWRRTGEALEFVRLGERGRPVHWVPPLDTQCADTLWSDIRGYSFRHRFATEKSEALLERLLSFFSEPGDWVLDSFAGSGTTAAVAARLGRRFVAIELGEQCHTRLTPRLREQGASFRLEQVVALT